MFQMHTVTDDERARMASREAIIPQAGAKAYGMVTARTVNGGRKFPRTTSAAHTSDCVVTTANGDVYTIKRGTGRARSNKGLSKRVTSKTNNAARYEEMLKYGVIGDSNH